MKLEYKIILYCIGVIIIIILSLLSIGRIQSIPTPAATLLGMIVLFIFICLDMSIEIFRGKSPMIISNVGHWSIAAPKDVHHFPWESEILKEDSEHKKKYGNLSFIFPGGIDFWGFNTHSSSEMPILIFPSRYEIREGNNYHVYANLIKKDFEEISPYIRKLLKSHFPTRVVKGKTPIYEGFTSHLDGSATPENLKIEFSMIPKYRYASELEERIEALYKELRKADEQKSGRHFFVGKEITKAEEET